MYVKREKDFGTFFGQQNKEETAETSTATDEAEPEENQFSELKLKWVIPEKIHTPPTDGKVF